MCRLVLVALAIALCSLGSAGSPEMVTVAAAVSLTDVLTSIAADFPQAHGGREIRFNFAASNVLARQIVNGAPMDVFISADEAQMDVVARAGLLVEGTRIDLLANELAVVVPDDRPRTFTSVRDLLDPAVKRIAIGDPAAVPAGVYARQYLEHEGLWARLQPRIVPTASVRAALASVGAGAADAAIVYRTDARPASRTAIAWVVPREQGPRIVYPAALIRRGAEREAARAFLQYLRATKAMDTFERFGFSRPAASR